MPAKKADKKVELIGMAELERNLKKLGASIYTKEAKAVYTQAGHVIRKWARYFAPYDKTRKKGTHLRDAILVSPGPMVFPNVLVTVRYRRPGAPHAHLIEFGTSRAAPHPYMRPAAATGAQEVADVIRKGLLPVIVDAVS